MAEPVTTSMDRLCVTARALWRDRSASVSMEYGLVGTLVSVAIIGGLSSTSTGIGAKWNNVANTVISYLR